MIKNSTACRRAAKLLSKPGKWTRWAFARDKNGRETDADGSRSASFCLLGSVEHCKGDLHKVSDLHMEEYGFPASSFNDEKAKSRHDVCKRLRRLAQLLEKEGD